MAICPKCKKEIENLRFYSKVENYGYFNISENGNEEWNTSEYGDWSDIEFCCPECNEVLFTDKNEDEAIEFLSNKDKLKELMVKKVIQNGRQKKRSN